MQANSILELTCQFRRLLVAPVRDRDGGPELATDSKSLDSSKWFGDGIDRNWRLIWHVRLEKEGRGDACFNSASSGVRCYFY